MMLKLRRPRYGFTLIELAVVVLVLGIAAAAVMPKLSGGSIRRAEFRRAVNAFASTAAHARSLAAASGYTHMLRIDIVSGTYQIFCSDDDRRDYEEISLPEGTRFDGVEAYGILNQNNAVLRFTPEGWADSAAVWIAGPDDLLHTVVVSELRGRVDVHDSKVSLAEAGRMHARR